MGSATDTARAAMIVFPKSGDLKPRRAGAATFAVDGPTMLKRDCKRRFANSIGVMLVYVPAGGFLMGAPDTDDLAQKDEKPQHRVRISRSFYLGEREITVAQFCAFVKQ